MVTLQYSEPLTAPKKPPLVNVHNCKVCPYVTTSFFLMMNHKRRHQSPLLPFNCKNTFDSYHCKDCDFQTELTLLFKQHIKEHHGIKHENDDLILQYNNQKYVCRKCGFETYFSLKWLLHMRECPQIKVQPNSKQHLVEDQIKRHIKTRHLDDLDAKLYECQQCPYKTRDCSNLRRHVKSHHLNAKSITWYKCTECSFKTKHEGVFQKHVKARHSNQHGDIKWYNCEKCQYKTEYRQSIHIKLFVLTD
ncbi:RE1-silencing transcription factor-like [Zophobas morio]|uniref:RE1-silencing transcription factor-like n=1 Tax=Zophobas morio TaxID=2755281 RepID=UPI0030838EC7